MLQISSGMYFDSAELYETVHSRVVHSNGVRGRTEAVELPIGTLRFTSGYGEVQPLIIEAVDRLEKVNSDGSPSMHIATGGSELIDDVADVVAFGLDIVMLADSDLAQRMVSAEARGGRRRAKPLRHVLEPGRFIADAEIDGLRDFCKQLLALERTNFEAAMRAIRRVADAVTLASSDVSLSYTLFVAALESLSKDEPSPVVSWENYDGRKRKVIDAACEGLPEERAEKIRAAVLQVDMLSLRRKFQGFVIDHITEEFYRSGAANSARPIRAVELPKALDFAYQVRSKTMHELRDLAPELRELAQQDDTIWHDGQTVLSLEGLHRICQHVIRQYIERAPTGVDSGFKTRYRDAIPGTVRMRLAPQHWLPGYGSFTASESPRIFSALVDLLLDVYRGDSEGVPDLTRSLERIEALLPGEARDENRLPLIAVYMLWHAAVAEGLRRPGFEKHLDAHHQLLDEPSMFSYTLGTLFSRAELGWSDAELEALADEREAQLTQQGKSLLELPPRLDAALQLDLAQRAWKDGKAEKARERVAKAIELLPGDNQLITLEERLRDDGVFPDSNLRNFVIAQQPEEVESEKIEDQVAQDADAVPGDGNPPA